VDFWNRAEDDVIAAALAHEMGHLFGDGHVRPVVSVKGCNEDLGAEGRADAYGVELLRVEHLPPESMVRSCAWYAIPIHYLQRASEQWISASMASRRGLDTIIKIMNL